jgi:hypothetical protein
VTILDEEETFAVRYMTANDAVRAGNWLNYRVQQKSGVAQAAFPREIFPATGLSFFAGNSLLAVAFLYLEESSSVAVCGWCATNPGNSAHESARAVKELMAAMPQYARERGKKYLLTTFGNRGINRILAGLGFHKGENTLTMYMNL